MALRIGYCLPRIDDIFHQLNGAKSFSKIRLRSGYHQIRLDHNSMLLIAFRTRYGHFEFLVLPFGLTSAPAKFMILMNEVFADYLDNSVTAYLGNVLIYSKTMESHVRHLQTVIELLRKHKLYGEVSKCVFTDSKVEYLGHIIGSSGIAVDPKKVRSIEDWPKIANKKDVQTFLDLVNYCQSFIDNCSKNARSLTILTKNQPFV